MRTVNNNQTGQYKGQKAAGLKETEVPSAKQKKFDAAFEKAAMQVSQQYVDQFKRPTIKKEQSQPEQKHSQQSEMLESHLVPADNSGYYVRTNKFGKKVCIKMYQTEHPDESERIDNLSVIEEKSDHLRKPSFSTTTTQENFDEEGRGFSSKGKCGNSLNTLRKEVTSSKLKALLN